MRQHRHNPLLVDSDLLLKVAKESAKDLTILSDDDVVGVPVPIAKDVGSLVVAGARVGERFNGLGQLVPVVLCWLVACRCLWITCRAASCPAAAPSPSKPSSGSGKQCSWQPWSCQPVNRFVFWSRSSNKQTLPEIHPLSTPDEVHDDDNLEGQNDLPKVKYLRSWRWWCSPQGPWVCPLGGRVRVFLVWLIFMPVLEVTSPRHLQHHQHLLHHHLLLHYCQHHQHGLRWQGRGEFLLSLLSHRRGWLQPYVWKRKILKKWTWVKNNPIFNYNIRDCSQSSFKFKVSNFFLLFWFLELVWKYLVVCWECLTWQHPSNRLYCWVKSFWAALPILLPPLFKVSPKILVVGRLCSWWPGPRGSDVTFDR